MPYTNPIHFLLILLGPSGANGGKIAFSRAKKWEKVRFLGPNSTQNLHLLGPKIVYEVLKVHTPWTLEMTEKLVFKEKWYFGGPHPLDLQNAIEYLKRGSDVSVGGNCTHS